MKHTTYTSLYDAYLLRLWRGDEENPWRWMIENIRTGERKGFHDMDTLVHFLISLRQQADSPASALSAPD